MMQMIKHSDDFGSFECCENPSMGTYRIKGTFGKEKFFVDITPYSSIKACLRTPKKQLKYKLSPIFSELGTPTIAYDKINMLHDDRNIIWTNCFSEVVVCKPVDKLFEEQSSMSGVVHSSSKIENLLFWDYIPSDDILPSNKKPVTYPVEPREEHFVKIELKTPKFSCPHSYSRGIKNCAAYGTVESTLQNAARRKRYRR